ATVTPSFVIGGGPNVFSRTTLRRLGPNVILTAFASTLMPRRNRSVAACVVHKGRDEGGMEVAVVLRQIGAEGHLDFYRSRQYARHAGTEYAHERLAGETRPDIPFTI